jgi:hypothetical protein
VAEKRLAVKGQGMGKAKKKKTPIKNSVKEAMQTLVKPEGALDTNRMKSEEQEMMEVGMADEAIQPKLDPKPLTGAHMSILSRNCRGLGQSQTV